MSIEKKELSAIDAIYKILAEIKDIKQQIVVIDNNIKLINNKLKKIGNGSAPSASAAPSAQPANSPRELIKVFGRIKNQRKKPISGVYVKIYSPSGEVLKSRETDSEGYWEARVAPGSYGVELNASHLNPKFRPINKNIIVEETMNEYEVK